MPAKDAKNEATPPANKKVNNTSEKNEDAFSMSSEGSPKKIVSQ